MQTSIFLARLIGPVMTVVGLAVLLNRRGFRELAQEFVESRALIFLSGLVILPAGVAIILVHNVWAADGRLMITLFGWVVAITSAVREAKGRPFVPSFWICLSALSARASCTMAKSTFATTTSPGFTVATPA